MHASTVFAAAAALWATSVSASAMPTAYLEERALEKRADQTAPWVTVDDEGQPAKTYTPHMETSGGTTKVVDAAPHDITASVYTFTSWEKITTSTGAPPNPTATGKNNEGAFARCYNTEGDWAPFCDPANNSTLLTGNTYYVTWDPDYFNTTNDNTPWEVAARVDWWNRTAEEFQKLKTFDRVPARWGYWPFYVDSAYLKGHTQNNITVTLYKNVNGSTERTPTTSLPLLLKKPSLPDNPDPTPDRKALIIALPTVFGAIVLLLIGGCLWNRKTRRIELGNIMSRSRHGYTGRKTRRVFGGARKDNGIQLDTSADAPLPGEYRDVPDTPRRDSDALGSLAGSPVDPNFQHGGSGNAFRDELRRQDQERR